jgi:hypothetical protein
VQQPDSLRAEKYQAGGRPRSATSANGWEPARRR